VVLVCLAFVAVDLGVALPSVLKEMQAKSKAVGLDFFDWAILIIFLISCIGKTVASYMNKGFARWSDQREEERKTQTALVLKEGEEREQAKRDFGVGK